MKKTAKKIKILFIGNSFSDDTSYYMPNMFSSIGYEEVEIANAYIGGCNLSLHRKNAEENAAAYSFRVYSNGKWDFELDGEKKTLDFMIRFKEWDIISLQQASYESGKEETYNSDIDYIIEYVKARAKVGVKFVWNMTWAYQKGFSDLKIYKDDQTYMYESIVSAVRSRILSNGNFSFVIPTGTAIQNARTSFLGDNLNLDGTHLSQPFGRYVAALTAACAIAETSPQDVRFVCNDVDERSIAVARESVNNAIKERFSVTKSEII